MSKLRLIIYALAIGATSACHPLESYDDVSDFSGNFDALWEIVDQHYCFFDEKDIDWTAVLTAMPNRRKTPPDIANFSPFALPCSMSCTTAT